MRLHNGTPVIVIAASVIITAGLTGCSAVGTTPGASPPSTSTAGPASASKDTGTATHDNGTSGYRLASVRPGAASGVRLAAEHYYALSSAGHFAASWKLLTATARHLIPQRAWTGVHDACQAATSGRLRTIKSVTVLGTAAIVLTTVTGAPKNAGVLADVFSLVDGHWDYSPAYPGVYDRGSVGADAAVATKAGLCGGWKNF